MKIDYFDVCGTPALQQVEARLEAAGYKQTWARLGEGQFSSSPSDGAPGWSDWMYEVAIVLKEGDTLEDLL